MASAMLNGAENITLFRGIAPTPKGISARPGKNKTLIANCSLSASRPASQPRFIQHKKEAFWFYRFLSIVYDHVINPGHWTEDMRDEALEPADLNNRKLTVVMLVEAQGSPLWG
ncbi:UNVERIFIED_CONTAM: 2-methyl-6-phytyl-1,4-hydroquinone methyltransferase, chloroplastic [Sesamum latifolium]|uniref:2-methyl-6-phytyl-1,4-hydroquinone methyltransferase, chloroplastic n=1 Tax=Sesamum latifolium TaxID=2727402 RepID=A0AAW2Y176_9LAMI